MEISSETGGDATESPALADLLEQAQSRVSRQREQRDLEIVASEIVIELVQEMVEDPSLEKLKGTVLGLLLSGQSPSDALLGVGISNRGAHAVVPDDKRLSAIGEGIARLEARRDPQATLAELGRLMAERHSDTMRRIQALEALVGPGAGKTQRSRGVQDAPLLSVVDAPRENALNEASGPADTLDRRSDLGLARGKRAPTGREESHSNILRNAATEYMRSQGGHPVTLAQVHEHIASIGITPEHRWALEDVFSKSFVRIGKDRWLTPDEGFPDALPSRKVKLPRQKEPLAKAKEAVARWNRGRPVGDHLVVEVRNAPRTPSALG